jgi:hypothetical protein
MNDTEKKMVAQMLDELISRVAPRAATVPKYGGTLYTLKPDERDGAFCGIFGYRNHVQLAFAHGTRLNDPASVLLGGGRYRRHINFSSPDEIDPKVLLPLLKQSIRW